MWLTTSLPVEGPIVAAGYFVSGSTVTAPSHDEIAAARTTAGGWTRSTLASWGVSWPPPKGWRARLVDDYERASGALYNLAWTRLTDVRKSEP
jgi:hypothetical protein